MKNWDLNARFRRAPIFRPRRLWKSFRLLYHRSVWEPELGSIRVFLLLWLYWFGFIGVTPLVWLYWCDPIGLVLLIRLACFYRSVSVGVFVRRISRSCFHDRRYFECLEDQFSFSNSKTLATARIGLEGTNSQQIPQIRKINVTHPRNGEMSMNPTKPFSCKKYGVLCWTLKILLRNKLTLPT